MRFATTLLSALFLFFFPLLSFSAPAADLGVEVIARGPELSKRIVNLDKTDADKFTRWSRDATTGIVDAMNEFIGSASPPESARTKILERVIMYSATMFTANGPMLNFSSTHVALLDHYCRVRDRMPTLVDKWPDSARVLGLVFNGVQSNFHTLMENITLTKPNNFVPQPPCKFTDLTTLQPHK